MVCKDTSISKRWSPDSLVRKGCRRSVRQRGGQGCPRSFKRHAGATLAGTVVAVGVASILFMSLAAVYLYSARSFVGLGNYMSMDVNARMALDVMTSDIRQADSVRTYATNAVTFNVGTNQLTYSLNTAQKTLTRQLNSVTRTLLTDCDDVRFDCFQRNPSNGVYDYFPETTAPTNAKVVQVTVLCTRSVLGSTANSALIQSAKIVIRKQQ